MIAPIAMPPPTYEQTAAAVASCGVERANVRIIYEEELQSDVVMVGELGGDEEAKVRCLAEAVHPFYLLDFGNPRASATYWTLEREKARREATADGRQWLQERGLLRGLPLYRPGKVPLTRFVRDVEAHCSVKPGRAIEILTPTSVTIRVAFMRSVLAKADGRHGDRLTCLMNVLAVSDLAEGGVHFGFVGNEAIAAEGERR
jgi:hypothetical protein